MKMPQINFHQIFNNVWTWFINTFDISEHLIRDLVMGGIVAVVVIILLQGIGGER